MALGDTPILVDWLGGAVVGLVVGLLWNLVLKFIDQPGPFARVLISGLVGVAVGAGAVVVFTRESSSSPEDDTLEVLVVWNGSELSAFEQVVSRFGSNVRVESAGPAIADRLEDLFADGEPPDVAIIPQPSVVKRLASLGRIEPIDEAVVRRFPDAWNQLVQGQHGAGPLVPYGVFVKGAHKSLFWYHPEAFPPGTSTPEEWSWADFANWARAGVSEVGFDAPLTVPANNEWPLTDWFENHLAALDPDLYDSLAEGATTEWDQPAVRAALHQIADLWQSEGMFDGGWDEVSDVELEDLTAELGTRDAAVMFAPSFVGGAVSRMDPEDAARPFGYPRVEGRRPQVVGGDIAVVTSGSSRGHRFVEWLTNQAAMAAWAGEDRGFLTPNLQSPYRLEANPAPTPDDAVHVLLTSFLTGPEGELHFDLSDEFGGVNEGRPCIMWRIFWDFFQAVTRPDADEVAITAAVDQVIANLNAEAQGLDTEVTCG